MNLREARFRKNMSQWKLAKKSKVHQSRISLAENELYIFRNDEAARISEALGVDINQIEWPN